MAGGKKRRGRHDGSSARRPAWKRSAEAPVGRLESCGGAGVAVTSYGCSERSQRSDERLGSYYQQAL